MILNIFSCASCLCAHIHRGKIHSNCLFVLKLGYLFLLLSFTSFLYILAITHLWDIWLVNIFPPLCQWHFLHWLCFLFKLWYNQYNINVTVIPIFNVQFSGIKYNRIFCTHHNHRSPEFFSSCQTENVHPLNNSHSFASPLVTGNHHLTFVNKLEPGDCIFS